MFGLEKKLIIPINMSLKSKIKKEDWLCYGYAPVHVKLNFKEEIYKENSRNKCKYHNFTEIYYVYNYFPALMSVA